MTSIIGIIALIAVISLAALLVYYIVYSIHINSKITSDGFEGQHMIDVPNAIRVVIIIALLIYAVFVTIALNKSGNQVTEVNHNTFAVVNLTDYSYNGYIGTLTDKDASYAKNYSKEKNEGYKKSVSEDGNFVFTVFTRVGQRDAFHPDFFCFVDYTGEKNNKLSLYEYYEFIDTVSQESGGGVGSGGSIENSFLVIGNVNDNESFKINLSILNGKGEKAYSEAEQKAYEEDKGEFKKPSDYAISSGSVVITVNT